MSVLYRKYRPNNLDEVVGQDHIKRYLVNAVKNDSMSHAMLLTGIRGTGKTTLARIIAQIVNCENGPSIEYSSEDPVCKAITDGSCPDVHEIDAATNTSIDDVRELRKAAFSVPMMGRKRVFIIDECLPKEALVSLQGGSQRSIKEIIEDDTIKSVMSFNLETGEMEEKTIVRKIIIKNDKQMKLIKVKNKSGQIQELRITSNHSVFLQDGAKIKVGDLNVGDKLLADKISW